MSIISHVLELPGSPWRTAKSPQHKKSSMRMFAGGAWSTNFPQSRPPSGRSRIFKGFACRGPSARSAIRVSSGTFAMSFIAAFPGSKLDPRQRVVAGPQIFASYVWLTILCYILFHDGLPSPVVAPAIPRSPGCLPGGRGVISQLGRCYELLQCFNGVIALICYFTEIFPMWNLCFLRRL